MNETIKNILKRQTIRSYKQQQITDEELDILIQAAKRAPSGRNSQPCHVRFIQNHDYLDSMNRESKEIVS